MRIRLPQASDLPLPFLMLPEKPFNEATELISSEFDLAPFSRGLDAPDIAYNTLKRVLTIRIAEMLHSEFERLLAVLYRVDVGEEQAQAALRERNSSVAAERLADLIIARQIEKAESRMRRRPGA